jgi:hypothetical protein
MVAQGAEYHKGKGAFRAAKQGSRSENAPSLVFLPFAFSPFAAVAPMIITYDKPADHALRVF